MSKKIRVLLTNDDSVNALGLRTMAKYLAQNPRFEVYVVAPDHERSASGRAITIHDPIKVKSRDDISEYAHVAGVWETSGTPADCVKLGVYALFEGRPDVVVSGINRGANLGTDILYSGTVAGAVEGALLNIPAMAVSLVAHNPDSYDLAAQYVVKLIEKIVSIEIKNKTFLNVNIPYPDIKGETLANLCNRQYLDVFEKRLDPRGNEYYWLSGEIIEESGEGLTDSQAIEKGLVTITPIELDMRRFGGDTVTVKSALGAIINHK